VKNDNLYKKGEETNRKRGVIIRQAYNTSERTCPSIGGEETRESSRCVHGITQVVHIYTHARTHTSTREIEEFRKHNHTHVAQKEKHKFPKASSYEDPMH